ncbi:TetR/AcrR family transcriptional regulator [Amycolatopsis sp. PS_44_ISF1]|uniref:TetR/AcrR family transcriptional regulator n=1 Tax=Amycolatopsis sp. PS_44_ISF1 TaxID=2974917 RepID=UPI0028DF803A|nr:TetR/AcrR family transcriptional regulator [Amycolatopsis sp. PS_44_ISF1]MDT8913197.1 TetR/AcrR family transcriptional regulator [Amycolatopsis sp. PS_44_ISF1]
MDEPPGRRERKKARTRRVLADAAMELFQARGYDAVSVKEVAEAADVSVTTLFNHFPSKEALVFDLDGDVEAGLVAAVRDRGGRSVPAALREHLRLRMADRPARPEIAAFRSLVEQSPALRAYADRMWLRHETALAEAIAADAGVAADDVTCAALARFALEAVGVARRYPDAPGGIDLIFGLLDRGWSVVRP